MLGLDDVRWNNLTGGYKTPFDPRPLLIRLETEPDAATVWDELWDELHHQGDVGESSYAVIPHLVRIHRMRGLIDDWNIYAIVAIIELARTETRNPKIPEWLEQDYFRAIEELAEVGIAEISRTKEPDAVRAKLSIIAIAKGLRNHGRFLVNYSESEIMDAEPS
jgi:hypothetical protein